MVLCCFQVEEFNTFPTPSGFSQIHGELARKNSQHLPILVSWVREGGGRISCIFCFPFKRRQFCRFFTERLLVKVACWWKLGTTESYQPFRFRLLPTVLVSHYYHHFLPSISTKGDDWERLAVQKKRHMRCAFRRRKAAPFFRCWGVRTFHRHHGGS